MYVSFLWHCAHAILCRSNCQVRSSSTGLVGRLRLTIVHQSFLRGISSRFLMQREGRHGWCRLLTPSFPTLDLWSHLLNQFYQVCSCSAMPYPYSLTIFSQACDVLIPPMNPWVPEAGTELPPCVVVATPEQVSAANRRRTNAVPGRFACNLCRQNFTAKHNLKSQS